MRHPIASRVILALTLVLAAAAAANSIHAQTEPTALRVAAVCDPGDWVAAKLGRPALLHALGVEEPTLVAVTGGALVAGGAPTEVGRAYPLAMLAAAGVDVVNLAHRDLVGDAAALAAALGKTRVRFLGANLRLAEGTPTPWQRYTIIERGGLRTAVVGVAEPSASMMVPGSGAIAGLRVGDPAAALREVLAEVKGKADRVVVLADASGARLSAWLKGVPGVDLVVFSGRAGVSDLTDAAVRLVAAPPGGRAWTIAGPGAESPRRLLLVEPEQCSPAFTRAAGAVGLDLNQVEVSEPTAPERPRVLEALRPGETRAFPARACNRAVALTLRSIALLDRFGGRAAPLGRRFLLVTTHWQNILTPQLVREQLVPVAYQIPKLSDHLYAVADGQTLLVPGERQSLAGVLGWGKLSLPLPGSTAEGRLLFLVRDDQPLASLELRFYDFAHGPMRLTLVRSSKPPADAPPVAVARNQVLEMSVHGRQRQDEPGDTVLISVDLRARSLVTMDADATAFDPKAKRGSRIQIGTVADWADWRRYTQLLVDGDHAHPPLDPVELPAVPRFLPDVATGGVLRFRVPATYRHARLVCGMPNARLPGGKVIRPRPIVLAWEAAKKTAPTGANPPIARPQPSPPAHRPARSPAAAPAAASADVPALGGEPVPGFTPTAADIGGARLGLLDARVVRECLERKAAAGMVFLLVQTRWRREGEADWQSRSLGTRFFLHRRGLFQHKVWNICWNRPGHIPSRVDLRKQAAELVCTAVFQLAAEDLAGSTLVYATADGQVVTLPIAPSPVERKAPPVLAQAENEALILRFHGCVPLDGKLLEVARRTFGNHQQPVALLVSATAKQRAFHFANLPRGAQLLAGGTFPCPPFFPGTRHQAGGWPAWPRSLQMLPGVTEHGLLLYGAPDPTFSLALEVDLCDARASDGKPLEAAPIRLTVRAGKAWPTSEPLARMAGPDWAVELIGVRKAGDDKYPSVAVDVRITRIGGAGAKPIPDGAIEVLDQISNKLARPSAKTPYTPPTEILFPAGAVRRFERVFRLPDRGTRLWLRAGNLVPGSLVPLPNPWLGAERTLLSARKPLEIRISAKGKVPYTAPPLRPEPRPRGIEGAGLTARQVNEAIRKGAHFLMKHHARGFESVNRRSPLVILALLHSLELQQDPALYANAVACLENQSFSFSYDAALTIMGLAWVDPIRYRPRIRRIAQALVDGQCERGCWHYIEAQVKAVEPEAATGKAPAGGGTPGIEVQGGEPIPGWPGSKEEAEVTLSRTTKWGRLGGDYSCSQYAVLGLLAASKAGVRAPRETWERALGWYVKGHNPGRGWGYGSRSTSSGSMNTAGLAGLAITCFFLGETTPVARKALAEGVDWMDRNFRLDDNPCNHAYHFYYLYGLERAGRLLGKEFFGSHEWYPEGARYLVKTQAGDGSWNGNSTTDQVLDTSYALLFLTLATEKLGAKEAVPTGPGKLAVRAGGLGGSVLFILDASGSMGANLGKETRFDAARRVVLEVLRGSGTGMEVALRVYGHRHRALRKEADQDSELVIGFGAPDRPELAAALAKLRYRGKTPLTHSLKEALGDLRGASNEQRRVVLLTDGLESTRRADPVGAAAALEAAGVRLDVVGLCVDNRAALERMATAGGGSCYAAADADQLLTAFRAAVIGSASFRVFDAKGTQLAAGESGEEVTLPAGPYRVEVDLPDGTRKVEAWVHQDRTTTITVRPQG